MKWNLPLFLVSGKDRSEFAFGFCEFQPLHRKTMLRRLLALKKVVWQLAMGSSPKKYHRRRSEGNGLTTAISDCRFHGMD
jgi:hypothetical protein